MDKSFVEERGLRHRQGGDPAGRRWRRRAADLHPSRRHPDAGHRRPADRRIYFLLPKLVGARGGDRASSATPSRSGSRSRSPSRSSAFATYVALFRGVVGGDVLPLTWGEAYEINMAGLAATRLLLRRRRRRHRPHLLGAAQGRDAAARVGVPDGRLPRPSVHLVPAGADRLRGPAAHRRAQRRELGRGDDRARRRSPAIVIVLAIAIALIPHDIERRIAPLRPGPPARRARPPAGDGPGDRVARAEDGLRPGRPSLARRARASPARSASGRPTSRSSGPVSAPSGSASRSGSSSRASSSAWSPT